MSNQVVIRSAAASPARMRAATNVSTASRVNPYVPPRQQSEPRLGEQEHSDRQ